MRRVIKIGTSTVLTKEGGLDAGRLRIITEGVKRLMDCGDEVALVVSGAVGLGRGFLAGSGAHEAPRPALAALGQIALMQAYQAAFQPTLVAQLLMEQNHVAQPNSAIALQAALHHLWNFAMVPLVNENDALSGAGHRIGDNDTLAAMLAGLITADQLVILSDIDGLYTDNPSTNPAATRISLLPRISHEHFGQFGEGSPGPWGSGGIRSKLKAAKIAQDFGIETILASGRDDAVWSNLVDQRYDRYTRFAAQKEA